MIIQFSRCHDCVARNVPLSSHVTLNYFLIIIHGSGRKHLQSIQEIIISLNLFNKAQEYIWYQARATQYKFNFDNNVVMIVTCKRSKPEEPRSKSCPCMVKYRYRLLHSHCRYGQRLLQNTLSRFINRGFFFDCVLVIKSALQLIWLLSYTDNLT